MKTALVLEGGSLRCMFSAGIIDVLLENNIEFNGTFGSSAGSLTSISYITKQIGRTKRVNLNFAAEKNYVGFHSFLRHKSVFNFDYMFSQISDIYIPLDRKAFRENPCDFTATATSCLTGETLYFNKNTCKNIYTAVRAGSSMPLLSPIVDVEGTPCLDGGISCAVPYQKAIDENYDRIVVVLTRQHGFLKPQTSNLLAKLYLRKYHKYPEFVKTLIDTPRMYENQMRELDRLENDGRLLIIRPEKPINISRMEKDPAKLISLYEDGKNIALKKLAEIEKYISN